MLSWKGGVAMVNKRAFLVLTMTASLLGSASTALATDSSVTRRADKTPIAILSGPQVSAPTTALLFAGGQLLNVFRAVSGLGVVNFPTRGSAYQTYGIGTGPDGTDPLGAKETGKKELPAPARSRRQ
jgi:hypothetical protein